MFVNKRATCEAVVEAIHENSARKGGSHVRRALFMHGKMQQHERDLALSSFAGASVSVLVATDVAARGLHIECAKHVISLDFPHQMSHGVADWVHRVGRTGRAGRKGVAHTFLCASSRGDCSAVPGLCNVVKDAGQSVPKWMVQLANSVKRKVEDARSAKATAKRDAKWLKWKQRKGLVDDKDKHKGDEGAGEGDGKQATDD